MAPRQQSGFTLIEVLIAIVLMAVVSLICWRALDNITRTSSHLERHTEQSRSLMRVMQQFELDVAQRAGMELPQRQTTQEGYADAEGLLPPAVTALRQSPMPFRVEIVRAAADLPGYWQRVYWWRERDTLYRSAGQPSDRFPLPAPEPAAAIALLTEVHDFDLRAWKPGAGWTRLPDISKSASAPGLELRLTQRTSQGDEPYRRVLRLR